MPIIVPDANTMIELAQERSEKSKVRIVAIAFTASGHVITKAVNKPVFGMKDRWTLHAEHLLINKLRKLNAKERYGDIFVLTLRWSRLNSTWAIAKPCEDCQRLLDQYGVRGIYYSTDEGEIIKGEV